ncbi:M3 family oligoendopeptidase [Alphaproteobacteria bacterium]|jgi:oligoendopeptidase F|nr:M3 family oligoendopeptidase [Alphaproteobacteria bacterium]|tara:strand:- start:1173 stop:2945 length:1773 start_codon:yes stop_codon:yes gene_type:complete
MKKSNNELPIWDLTEIYTDIKDPKIKEDLKNIRKISKEFLISWKDKIKNLNSNELVDCIEQYQNINEKIYKIGTHSNLIFATNMEDPEISRYNSTISDEVTDIFSSLIFVSLELSKISDDVFNKWMLSEKAKEWMPYLKILRKRNPFILDPLVEEILIEKSATGRSAWVRLFDETSASLRFPFKKEMVSEAEILNYLSDPDPENRKMAGQSLSKILEKNKRILGMILNVISRDRYIEDNKRGFKRIVSSRNLDNDVEDEVVDALVKTVDEAMPKLTHRYYKWKAKQFGKTKLDWWDRNAPLPSSSDRSIEWSEAKSIVLESFASFHPEISKLANLFFQNNWIDAEVRKGKASGAFAHPSIPSLHPYVLLNYQGKIRDVMTLAHELGHGVHQILAAKNGLLMAETPLTLAETASVFGEMLVFRKLLEDSNDKEKKQLLAGKVEDMLNTVVRQIGFHQFEVKFHEARIKSELTPDEIGEIWMQTQSHAVGPYINLTDEYKVLWGYIPHFVHTPFYVYAYAFGDSLVNALWYSYQNSDKNAFAEKYLDMLSAGGTKGHNDLLKPFNLSAYDKSFWNKGVSMISGLMDELEKLE